ncbi:hypothetical protein ACFE04_015520 [Oxalis oulophora]
MSWFVAEIPQIITNFKDKSAQGLSISFLSTWIIGDLFNLAGCMLEPATLPTQFYMALLYTMTTTLLATQSLYYAYIYPHKQQQRMLYQSEHIKVIESGRKQNDDFGLKQANPVDRLRAESDMTDKANFSSSPISFQPLPDSHGRGGLYYTSARSLSSSHTPTKGSLLAQKRTNPEIFSSLNSIEEPLLDDHLSTQSAPARNIKTTLCLVPAFMFIGALIVHNSADKRENILFDNSNHGFVMQVGRKILQAGDGLLQENGEGSSDIGTFLGWGMAAIYMGGRLPQIWLNIRRGNLEGLSPFMFIFALVGNSTYVASILVNSIKWSSIRPNLPWLVDAGGCVLLDGFVSLHFIYSYSFYISGIGLLEVHNTGTEALISSDDSRVKMLLKSCDLCVPYAFCVAGGNLASFRKLVMKQEEKAMGKRRRAEDLIEDSRPCQPEAGFDEKSIDPLMEDGEYVEMMKELHMCLDKVNIMVKPGCSQDVLNTVISSMSSLVDNIDSMASAQKLHASL